MASYDLSDKTIVFRKLQAESGNEVCFDCSAMYPTLAWVKHGIFLCFDCSSDHIRVVRSTTFDSWTPEQLRTMIFGGNNRAKVFFNQHGWPDGSNIEAMFTSRAADLYANILSMEVAKAMLEESDEARKKFPNAKSISSAQFFGYLEPKPLATTHFSSLVDIAGQTKRKIFRSVTSFIYRDLLDCTIPLDVDYLCDIRKELTELMQKLNGKDAKTIPIDTRIEWVDKMCDRVFEATEDIDPFREDEPIVAMMDALVDDAVTLRRTVLTHRREFITKK